MIQPSSIYVNIILRSCFGHTKILYSDIWTRFRNVTDWSIMADFQSHRVAIHDDIGNRSGRRVFQTRLSPYNISNTAQK